jgi:hypothetical protein
MNDDEANQSHYDRKLLRAYEQLPSRLEFAVWVALVFLLAWWE